jgi:hypothetical protein
VIEELAADLLMYRFWDVDELGGEDDDWVWGKYPGF